MIEAIRKALNDYIQENNAEKCELCSKVIHNYFHTWKISQPFLCSPEIILYVAACAIKEEKPEIVKELLRIYEEVFPNADELSAISYLIRAEMILKFTTADMNSLDIVIKSIYKCINISNRVKNENILASACAMLYRSIRLYLRPMTRPYMIKYLKPIVKMLSESDMKAYKWQILFIRVLLEAYIQTGQRKEASHLVDMASNGPARHLPQQMVQLLVRASASNLASADRHISWAMGASVAPETDQTAPVEKPATYVDSHKRNNYPQMSGQLAQTLIQSGLVPANRIAKLRVVTKEGGEQVDEIVRLLRLLSPPEESADGRNARSEQLALSPTDPKKKTDISGEGAVPGDDEWTERIKFFPDDTFSLLFQLGLVAVARKLPAVTEACVCSCKRILTQEKLTDPASAEVCTELLRLELFALEEDFRCGSDAVDLIQVSSYQLLHYYQ
ncbi:hypothetical protein D915_010072 [Fasciola hepatica]|uniref:Uncharacterized protein n=1 Tax=Fasciola hepatica TaxID=6192 RepID=A0A4E0QUR5_FASHE|nr:hypothetical protein D915_010072 [Fasciola hepatica]